MNTNSERFATENFQKTIFYLAKLHEMAKLTKDLRDVGITTNEYSRLLELLEQVIVFNTERTDLPVIESIRWVRSLVAFDALGTGKLTAGSLKQILPADPPIASLRLPMSDG